MKQFFVTVVYKTSKGNYSTKTELVEAPTAEEAASILFGRVKNYKKCVKIYGGSSVIINNTK